MNKLLKYIFFVFLLFLPEACSDWLQVEPESEVTREEFWQTGNDVQAVVAGTYKALAGCAERLCKWGELRGDLIVPGQNITSDDRRIMDGFIYPENDLNRWNKLYRTINFANT